MTETKLIKLEKEIAKKVEVPRPKNKKTFAVDVPNLKKLAKRINQYENTSSGVVAQH